MPQVSQVEVQGLQLTMTALVNIGEELSGTRMTGVMQDSLQLLQSTAQEELVGWQSPHVGGVDTGQLRGSLESVITEQSADKLEGQMGTSLAYAPFVEYNTRPHWAPWGNLAPWASSHGVGTWVVQRAIATRGTYGKFYMKKSLEQNENEIVKNFDEMVGEIVG